MQNSTNIIPVCAACVLLLVGVVGCTSGRTLSSRDLTVQANSLSLHADEIFIQAQKLSYGGGPPDYAPIIVCQPRIQMVLAGTNAVFSVEAINPPRNIHPPLTYQWQREGPGLTTFSNIMGATSSTYSITNATTNDPAFFRVIVTGNGSATSEEAALLVYTTNSPMTVYGPPKVSSGSDGKCGTSYFGYANYSRSNGAGFQPTGATQSASNGGSRSDIYIEDFGDVDDWCCSKLNLLNIQNGCPAPRDNFFWFTVYFTVNPVPTTSYPIILNGFVE